MTNARWTTFSFPTHRAGGGVQREHDRLIPRHLPAELFVVPAAARGADIVAIEQNPEACRWLGENIRLNGVEELVTIIEGDAFDTSLLPNDEFDRAIIPTPYGMDTIFEVIAPRVKQGGMIHFYTFKNRKQAAALGPEFGQKGFEVVTQRRCGNVAPGISRWVYDLVKRKYV